ncbi:TetR/AcrR family transcriptional regulator [Rhodovibrionaceae bacterium A322]
MTNKATKRLSRQERYDALIQATFACVAQKGLEGTTIRDIADYAGVTFGLIRHYFANKEELIETTYSVVTARMTSHAQVAATQAGPNPADQLAAFVAASLSEPLVTPQYLAFWSNFIGKILFDDRMKQLHRAGYWEHREILERLVRETLVQAGKDPSPQEVKLSVVQVNSVIDGLWVEACLDVDAIQGQYLIKAGIESISRLLEVSLSSPSST